VIDTLVMDETNDGTHFVILSLTKVTAYPPRVPGVAGLTASFPA
jgi:hypothetical protein